MCWFLIHVASTTTYIYHQFNAFLKSIFKVQYITMCNQLCNNINYIKEQNIYGIGNYYIEIHISMNTKEIKMISATVMIYYRFFRQIYNSYFLSTNVLFFLFSPSCCCFRIGNNNSQEKTKKNKTLVERDITFLYHC